MRKFAGMKKTLSTASNEWLDLKQAEHMYPISKRTFWQWITKGKLCIYRPFAGRKVLLKRVDIDRLIEAACEHSDLDRIVKDTLADLTGCR
jgi:excisionase family DNA binding protein